MVNRSGGGDAAWGGAGAVVHGHQQMEGNAKSTIGEFFDADNLGNVFAVHGVMRGRKREGNENAHAFVIAGAAGVKVNAFLGGVDADGHILEMLVARLRRAHAERLRDFRASAAALIRERLRVLRHGFTQGNGYDYDWVESGKGQGLCAESDID